MFEMEFPGDQYPEISSADVKRCTNDYLARQYESAVHQEAQKKEENCHTQRL